MEKFGCFISAQGAFGQTTIAKGTLLEQAQAAVGGNVEILPTRPGLRAPVTAFVNEEGALEFLPHNELAARVLRVFHVDTTTAPGGVVWGNVFVIGRNDRGLSRMQAQAIVAVCEFFIDNPNRDTLDHNTAELVSGAFFVARKHRKPTKPAAVDESEPGSAPPPTKKPRKRSPPKSNPK